MTNCLPLCSHVLLFLWVFAGGQIETAGSDNHFPKLTDTEEQHQRPLCGLGFSVTLFQLLIVVFEALRTILLPWCF